jgi:hypothetical protein
MNYTPQPIDTTHITLPASLRDLTERLAENTHELWAQQRIKDGWTFGRQRDDAAKQHQCLIPYAELPRSEKEYDRIAVVGVLKSILALGFRIERATEPPPGS